MTKKNLEINILYFSNQGREITFTDIAQKKDCLDISDYEPDNFWAVMGGFEITIGGHFTIFRSSDFHYLVRATSFLIHSMYWIKNKKSDWFDKDDEFPNDVIVKSTGGNVLRLKSLNDTEFSFSYCSKSKGYQQLRGDRFFEDFVIEKKVWFKEVDIALEEYFYQLQNVIDKSEKPNKTNETMQEYFQVWTKIRV